ncbi:MAG: response regulator transcription factor [Candidatus Helarchaeota archaeon]
MDKKILVVDDEPDTVLLATRLLEMEGYQVIKAYDGAEALRKFYSEKPPVVLLDIKLPKKDGYEVCKEIKSKDNFKNTVIIMFTAKIFDSDREKGYEMGTNYYLTKPFSGKELVALINRVFNELQSQNTQT